METCIIAEYFNNKVTWKTMSHLIVQCCETDEESWRTLISLSTENELAMYDKPVRNRHTELFDSIHSYVVPYIITDDDYFFVENFCMQFSGYEQKLQKLNIKYVGETYDD